MARQLTGRQRLWLEHYLGDCHYNATKAAISAGYAPRSAHNQGSANLHNPVIAAAIDEHFRAYRRAQEAKERRRLAALYAR